MINCYCCSGTKFEDCCKPLIEGAKAVTAEALMRSRYTAYALADIEYLRRTTHPSMRKSFDPPAVEKWARESRWEKLEIIMTGSGDQKDRRGTFEFKAYYTNAAGQPQLHHELSNFIKELGRWFFVDGQAL